MSKYDNIYEPDLSIMKQLEYDIDNNIGDKKENEYKLQYYAIYYSCNN